MHMLGYVPAVEVLKLHTDIANLFEHLVQYTSSFTTIKLYVHASFAATEIVGKDFSLNVWGLFCQQSHLQPALYIQTGDRY